MRYQHASEMRADLKRLKRETTSGVQGRNGSGANGIVVGSAARNDRFRYERFTGDISRLLQPLPSRCRRRSRTVLSPLRRSSTRARSAALSSSRLYLLPARVMGFIRFLGKKPAAIPFQSFAASQVTNSGKALFAAISPDGKFVVSVMDEKGKSSLWLRNVATGSDTQILAPDPAVIASPAFSVDTNYIFYRKAVDASQTSWNLYRMPVLGGSPQLWPATLMGPTFSPDGKRMAYMRGNDPEVGKFRILTANLDGSDEKVLQIAPLLRFRTSLSWSPDGKSIALISYAESKAPGQISVFDIASSKDTSLTAFPDRAFVVSPGLPDGRGLLVNYADRASGSTNRQIGYVSYPDGRFQSVTNDIHGYRTLSISADGKAMVSIQQQQSDSVHVQPLRWQRITHPSPGVPNQARSRCWLGQWRELDCRDFDLHAAIVTGREPADDFGL